MCKIATTVCSYPPRLSLKGAEKQEYVDSVAPPARNRERDPSSPGKESCATAGLGPSRKARHGSNTPDECVASALCDIDTSHSPSVVSSYGAVPRPANARRSRLERPAQSRSLRGKVITQSMSPFVATSLSNRILKGTSFNLTTTPSRSRSGVHSIWSR